MVDIGDGERGLRLTAGLSTARLTVKAVATTIFALHVGLMWLIAAALLSEGEVAIP
jgi:hypothetical protein